ncbi:MAG TPA: cyclic nucleotide-binding domain-containing protein, partial [Candidatus Baltobacteraceae bacterium]|nr:cyclic nucleotide-binding domain-containing protein [Candidatus Baltobacteraceae bacterium]
MLTPDDVRGVPIFASLGDPELERLAKRSADIHLQPGEYVAHEGEGRALLVVLEGEASVTKSIDGIERVVGRRLPGEVFGEVPIVLGTSFLANLRAVKAARIMRIEPRDFHEAAATAPDLAAAVGALAQDRIAGLHDIAADAPPARATVVGERYDSQCRALRDFLDRNGV